MKPSKRLPFRQVKSNGSMKPDRILPQAEDLEEAVLGAMLIESELAHVNAVISLIQPEYFYKQSHQRICTVIKKLAERNDPIDTLTVTEECRRLEILDNVGGPYAITMLSNKTASTSNIDYWLRIIYQKYVMREIIRIGHEKICQAYEDIMDCFDLLSVFISDLMKLEIVPGALDSEDLKGLIDEMMEELSLAEIVDKTSISKAHIVFYTGWPRFDRVVTLARDKIILMAGAAKSGKSKFIRSIMYRLLERYEEVSICWVTLEDSRQDLFLSYLSSKLFIPAKQIRLKQYSPDVLPMMKDHASRFKTFDIEFIDQTLKSDEVTGRFVRFCETRKGRFNILVLDNILSLDDQADFKFDPNGFCNHVMQNLLKCRQKTHGLIMTLM